MIQFLIACLVIVFGIIYQFTEVEWMWIISCISVVVLSEISNTLIERVCDLVDSSYNSKIKIIKDMAAGSVLLACGYAVVIGCMVLKGVLR